jgi:hypothetical protein
MSINKARRGDLLHPGCIAMKVRDFANLTRSPGHIALQADISEEKNAFHDRGQ